MGERACMAKVAGADPGLKRERPSGKILQKAAGTRAGQ